MIILYSFALSLLRAAAWLVASRARMLERKFGRTAAQLTTLINEPQHRPGNSNRADTFQNARRQYRLGLLVEKQERLESRHFAWQRLADRLHGVVRRMQAWRGLKLPYTFGVVDISALMVAVDQLGFGEFTRPSNLAALVQTWWLSQ